MTHRQSRRIQTSKRIYLLRHAQSEANISGILAGQTEGIHLSREGKKEARKLLPSLQRINPARVVVSPLERCYETVLPFCEKFPQIPVYEDESFIEMDYGTWSNRRLADLAKERLWKKVQEQPSKVRFPDGESFSEMTKRSRDGVLHYLKKPGDTVIVSHGDVIRTLLAHFLNMSLDDFQRISIAPASLSVIHFRGSSVSIEMINSQTTRNSNGRSTLGGGL
ncbi:MAG: hypothetical protein RL414_981 [Actinomycetota bacterium]